VRRGEAVARRALAGWRPTGLDQRRTLVTRSIGVRNIRIYPCLARDAIQLPPGSTNWVDHERTRGPARQGRQCAITGDNPLS